tara:strand:- start:1627 stop:1959 length:333 start_codon:yes stop_codon:yes gene_type:complete
MVASSKGGEEMDEIRKEEGFYIYDVIIEKPEDDEKLDNAYRCRFPSKITIKMQTPVGIVCQTIDEYGRTFEDLELINGSHKLTKEYDECCIGKVNRIIKDGKNEEIIPIG